MLCLFIQDNKTAIFWAVEKGHVNVARALVEFSANVEIPNKVGHTEIVWSLYTLYTRCHCGLVGNTLAYECRGGGLKTQVEADR